MALVLADRVQETSTTSGTGPLTLAGAVAGYQSFAAIGNNNTTYYTIVDTTAGMWEVGIGTYSTTGPTLTRTTVVSSSSGGSAVSFLANSKNVFVTYPAEYAAFASNNPGSSGQALISNGTGVAPSWQAIVASTATSIAGGANTQIPFQNGVGSTTFSSNLTFDGTFLAAPKQSASTSITGSSNTGAFSYGSLGYSDVNVVASYYSSANTYLQMILQNGNSGTGASTDIVISNDQGTATTYYGNLGMNSSTYTGSGSLNLPNAVYLVGQNGDLVLGTTSNNNFRVVINGNTTDAITVNTAGAVAYNGSYGSSGQVLVTNGSAAPPTYQTVTTLASCFTQNLILGY